MTTDPAPFLSTIILASAGLVAIVGGLLVARFVGLDSDERSNRRVVLDAAARLDSARRRAAAASESLRGWEARHFLDNDDVLEAISRGVSELAQLRRFADSPLSDLELLPFVAEVVDEFGRARVALAERVTASNSNWEEFRLAASYLPEIRWPGAWELVFDEIAARMREEEERARRSRPGPQRLSMFNSGQFVTTPDIAMARRMGEVAAGRPQTEARRYDNLRATDQRAQQRVEDYADELGRLAEAHREIVRPDARLWWGVAILVVFAIVGVGLPTWEMSRGPADLASVQWLVYPFGVALVGLLVYIVAYLAQLGRRKAPELTSPGGDKLPPSGS